jgi:hypothetical protein
MNDDLPPTQPGGNRPPSDPPGRVALGGAGGEDESHDVSALRLLLEEAHRQVVRDEARAMLEGAQAFTTESAVRTLAEAQPPEVLAAMLGALRRQRDELREQLELERLVKRPPRRGFELIHPEDDEPSSLARTVGLVEALVEELEKAAQASPE